MSPSSNRFFIILTGVFAAVLAWSAVRPHDRFTWFLEVLPALIGITLLAATFNKFRFTSLVYVLMLVHSCILMVGGHYTYAEVPLFNWLRDEFGLARNYYDRVGHFAQGFIPAMITREILVRKSPAKSGGWLVFTVISFCLAFSACYELFEWAVARATGEAADAFLGTQGDVWDTQWDMFLALCGASAALALLSRLHDRFLKREISE